MRVRSWIWRLLAVLGLLVLLAWPTFAHADDGVIDEVILHVSDTHVAPGDNEHWKAFAQAVVENADGIAAVVHSGDATNDPTSSAFFTEALLPPWNQILNATSGIMALGNHDIDAAWSWYRQGLGQYARIDTPTYTFIAYDFRNGSFQVVEEMVAQAAREGRRVILVSHQPPLAPWWVKCEGGACTSPSHLLAETKTAILRRIIGTYDVEILFAGHIHATYQMRDGTPGYDLIVPGNLGSNVMPGKWYTTVFLGEHVTTQPTLWSDLPAVFRNPPYYDAVSNYGWVLTPTPVQLLIVGQSHASKVKSVALTVPVTRPMSEVQPGVWEAPYDWKLQAGLGIVQLTAVITYQDGKTRTVTMPVRVPISYPNPAPAADISLGAAIGTTVPVRISVSDNASELWTADLYLDGVRVQSWSLAGKGNVTLTWNWDQAKRPGTRLKVKVVDVFSRKRYAYYGGSSVPSTRTPTPTPGSDTATQTATPTVTTTPTTTPQPGACAPGQVTLSPVLDTYIFKAAANSEDAHPATASILSAAGSSAYPFYRSLLRFDLSGLPAGAQIASATLALVVKSWYYPDGVAPTVALARLGKAFDASASWTQAAIGSSWTQAGAAAVGTDYLLPTVEKKLVWGKNVVDITTLASDWVAAPDDNRGLRLGVVSPSHAVTFYAADATLNQPALTIDYLCATAPVLAAEPTGTLTPTPTDTPEATPTPTETPTPQAFQG